MSGDHNIFLNLLFSITGLFSVICFCGFTILQAEHPEHLERMLKPKGSEKWLTRRDQYSAKGIVLIVACLVGGTLTFGSAIGTLTLWMDINDTAGFNFTLGFFAFMGFECIWMNVSERKRKKEIEQALKQRKDLRN